LTELGAGEVIYDLRKQIQKITDELNSIENDSKDYPELIKSTNILRLNDHLTEVNLKKSGLISAYEQYSIELEQMLATVFEIQKDLKEILKTQSSLISENDSKKKAKIRKKPSKK